MSNELRNAILKSDFFGLKKDFWYSKYFSKIGTQGEEFILNFLIENAQYSPSQFSENLSRQMVDSQEKPKNPTEIWELLQVLNSRRSSFSG